MEKILIYFILLSTLLVSCKKEAALNVDLSKSNPITAVERPIDTWLNTNFLTPYNMEVLYKFDRFQAPIDKDLVPVLEDQVQPVMEAVRDIWIEPYLQTAGKAFLKPLVPKQIALVGSAQYNIDGSITLGTADAGRRINLFVVNDYDKTNLPNVVQMLHTIHHEFVHILHQNIPVPPDYEKISPEYVGGGWISFSNTAIAAKDLGFITRYSRMNKDEDFAEMASFLLVEGQDAFNAYANTSIATAEARLRQKELAIVDYYKVNYGIDFRALQERVRIAKETLTGKSTPFITNLTSGVYKGFTVQRSAAGQSAAFVTAFNTSIASVQTDFGIPINSVFDLDFTDIKTNRTDMILKLSGSTFAFWYNLKATIDVNTGGVKLALAPAGTTTAYANGTLIQPNIKPLLDYLTLNNFRADWIENVIPGSKNTLAGFMVTPGGQLGFYGTLKK